jgi:hypothetical protein
MSISDSVDLHRHRRDNPGSAREKRFDETRHRISNRRGARWPSVTGVDEGIDSWLPQNREAIRYKLKR